MRPERPPELTRMTLQVVALSALMAASFWIIQPFLAAILWATTGVIATWPLLLHMQSWLGGKRSLAVALISIMLLLILVAPFYLAIATIINNIDEIANWSKSIATLTLPPPPAWVSALPVVGTNLAAYWKQVAAAGPAQLSAHLSPIAHAVGLWFLGQVGNLGLLLVQFVLTIIIISILYTNAEIVGRGAESFARRLAGPEGSKATLLAVQAVRGVALGIVVTALLQSILVGIGLVLAGVPFAALLTAVTLILALVQIGPVLLLIGAVIWVYSKYGAIWGTGFLLWAIFCGTFDNILRPFLIKRSIDIPLPLIVTGVIGGLIAFGVIGLFIGPVVLAVAYTLLIDWMAENEITPSPANQNVLSSDDV
ncbi:MAG: AI-2E family transporter YdiK [Deltaproteobacteria bacterium]|nr:AI-2E family transporter YdiK [Deltaproteobacteria bacterium]